ncbi:MAG: hypothetical protein KDC98_07240, partial [Planctomycetes bacterium]|nr:hypothetical protein [Planctomycetota bacterium]
MKHEVRRIPAAPRRVRLGALLAYRWPLLSIAGLLVVSGGLVSWMLFLAAGAMPSDQRRLDSGPTETVAATVTAIDPVYRGPDGISFERVHYAFRFDGGTLPGSSIAVAGLHAENGEVTVELLPAEPHINRIVGTVLLHPRSWLQPRGWLTAVVVPGALLLLGWLAGMFRLRQTLVHGDVSVGRITAVETVRGILP